MKHKAQLTISRPSYGDDRKKIIIAVRDTDAAVRFLKLEINYDDFTKCLTGLSEVPCDVEYGDLDKVGKKREMKSLEFMLPAPKYKMKKDVVEELAKAAAPEGWTPSLYFGSQDSFFKRDGEDYATTTISRWVDK